MQRAATITIQELLNRAADLFAGKGYRATTLDELASEFGVTKPALYYYVRNKHEILWLVFQHIMGVYINQAREIARTQAEPTVKLRRLITAHATAVLQNRSYTRIFFRDQSELSPKERRALKDQLKEYEKIFEDAYRQGVAVGAFRELEVHAVINGVLGMCNWLYQWYDPNGPLSADEITRLYGDLLEGGYAQTV